MWNVPVMFADLMVGPGHFERMLNTQESLLTRIVDVLDGVVFRAGASWGVGAASLFWIALWLYTEKVRRDNR